MSWERLWGSIADRWRPEDVATLASSLLPEAVAILRPATRGAWWGGPHFERYGRPGFRDHTVDTSILSRFPGLPSAPEAAVALLRQQTGLVTLDLRDRLPTPIRRQAGIKISRRQYNKQCRILLALARKLERVRDRGAFVRWSRIAKSGWALDITLADFMALTPWTRVFVAYYVARRQRQSVFSGSGQDSSWDKVSANLFENVTASAAVGLAFPDERVLGALTHRDRTGLLIKAYRELTDMAATMSDLWSLLGADRETMVVRRGMNSSDWNAIAGAWNSLRSLWIGLLYACGRESDLDRFCPGKAMRLMAADVAAWHIRNGSDEGPDVKVFKQLPLPWDVVRGLAVCTRRGTENACARVSVKPTNWTAPKTTGRAVATIPTHALVHGVAVSNPALADVLRRAGWFSGQGASYVPGVEVERTDEGFAVGVEALEVVAQR